MSAKEASMSGKIRQLDMLARETSEGVFHANEWGYVWGHEMINELKDVAVRSDRSRARLCLHPDTAELHQEMLIVMAQSAIELPQRRTTGFDTKIVIEGQAVLQYFSPDGERTRSVKLGGDRFLYVHTTSSDYHALQIESEWFVFLEILSGPFDATTTEFALWNQSDATGGINE